MEWLRNPRLHEVSTPGADSPVHLTDSRRPASMSPARWLRLSGVLSAILLLYFTLPVRSDPPIQTAFRAALALVVLVVLAAGLVTQLRLAARDGDRRVDGLAAAIATVLVVFAYGFYALEVHRPDQVNGLSTRLDALYFTASTMLTVGYGDVHAAGQAARLMVLVQMVFDVVFVAAAAALLTSRVRRAAAEHVGPTPSPQVTPTSTHPPGRQYGPPSGGPPDLTE
ncbi:potassium channel family protein [Nocardioides sp. NPDC092400]|uniref:potassium channel family protein n=1 Tax=Nocardioides sp. NPDC092400 TaxID=3155196 RepID=UPI00342CC0A0